MDERQVTDNQPGDTKLGQEIVWKDCNDVFKPTVRGVQDFLVGVLLKGINPEFAPYIFFEESAYLRMWNDARRDVSREHGGILVGEPFEDPGGRYYVVLRDAIAAQDPNGSPTHLHFRPGSWRPVWDKLYAEPSLRIVGWYHTHPRLGVFLSGTDLRTQGLYFSLPWQIAIVIDPVSEGIGYFFGASGKKAPFVRHFTAKVNGPEAIGTN